MIRKMTFTVLVLMAFLLLPLSVMAQDGQDVKPEETGPVQGASDIKAGEANPVQENREATAVEKKEEKSEASVAEGLLMGNITVGGAFIDIDHKSAKAGEYSGIDDDKFYIVGNGDISYRKGLFEVEVRGTDLGVNNRKIELEVEKYGIYEAYLIYDETPHLISNEAMTPFDGAGGSSLTLPAGFVKGGTTPGMTNLSSNLKDIDLKLERKAGIANFSIILGRDLNLKVSAKKEEKEGIKSIGGTIGHLGAVVLPEPVDYTTNEFGTTLSYDAENVQAEIGYHLSSFVNNNGSLSWDNPYNNNPTTGRTSLPPDNRYQKLSFSGGVNLPYSSRLSTVAEYGEMAQDEALLDYSNNTLTSATTPLPRNGADAEIKTTHVMLDLASRPLSRLGVNARYRYYKLNNETPRDLFQYVRTDSGGTSQPAVTDANAVYNLPYDYTQNQFKIDASYYMFKGTTLKAGYDFDVMDRYYREVPRTMENTGKIKFSSSAIPNLFLSADYSIARRSIDGDYDDSSVYSYYHTTSYISTLPSDERFGNNPDLRQFDIAERERKKYGAKLTLFGTQNTSVGIILNRTKDDYTESVLGLTGSDNSTYTLDFSFSPAESATIYSFYTKEGLSYDIAGREFTKGTSSVTDPSYEWRINNENYINTAGIGTTIDFMEKKLVVSADYSYSESDGSITFNVGNSIPTPVEMPSLKTYLHRLKASGKYKVTENLTAGVGYEVEKYSSDDWSTDGIAPASTAISNLLTLNESVGDYGAHKGIMYVSYNF